MKRVPRSSRLWLDGDVQVFFTRLGLGLGLTLEIERHRSADEILQGRFIDFVAFVDVDGAPDIPLEAGVE